MAREYYFRSAPLIILIPGDALLNNGLFPGITGQLVALVISSPKSVGQLVANSKIQLVNANF